MPSSLARADHEMFPVNADGQVCSECASHRFPLYQSCAQDHFECADVLIRQGADVNTATPTGVTPLFACCQLGHFRIAQLLSMHGARRVFLLNESGNLAGLQRRRTRRTAEEQVRLSQAWGLSGQEEGRQALAEWLAESRDWCTPLHHLELLPLDRANELLLSGADIHARAAEGAPSPLELAQAAPHGEVAQHILRAATPWSMDAHALYPRAAQRHAVCLLRLGSSLSEQLKIDGSQAFMDVWLACVMPAVITWDCGRDSEALPQARE